MNKVKMLATAALIAGLFAASAPAEARQARSHTDTTMEHEYGYQKDMKGNKVMKKKHHHKKKMHKKKMKKKHHHRHGTTPNECIKPPCGMNYNR